MKFLWLLGTSLLLAVSLAAQTGRPSSSLPAVKGEPTVPALMLAVQSGDAAAVVIEIDNGQVVRDQARGVYG